MTEDESDDTRQIDASEIELVVDGDSDPLPITDASVDMKETDREGVGSIEGAAKTYSGSFTINWGISDELREAMEDTLLTVAQSVLPELAENQPGWPVKYDHCFLRICYDNAVGGVWYDHVDGRPAYESMTDSQLFKATQIALAMMNGPPKVCRVLNQRSLDWRE